MRNEEGLTGRGEPYSVHFEQSGHWKRHGHDKYKTSAERDHPGSRFGNQRIPNDSVPVMKDTLAKLIVASGVEIGILIDSVLEGRAWCK